MGILDVGGQSRRWPPPAMRPPQPRDGPRAGIDDTMADEDPAASMAGAQPAGNPQPAAAFAPAATGPVGAAFGRGFLDAAAAAALSRPLELSTLPPLGPGQGRPRPQAAVAPNDTSTLSSLSFSKFRGEVEAGAGGGISSPGLGAAAGLESFLRRPQPSPGASSWLDSGPAGSSALEATAGTHTHHRAPSLGVLARWLLDVRCAGWLSEGGATGCTAVLAVESAAASQRRLQRALLPVWERYALKVVPDWTVHVQLPAAAAQPAATGSWTYALHRVYLAAGAREGSTGSEVFRRIFRGGGVANGGAAGAAAEEEEAGARWSSSASTTFDAFPLECCCCQQSLSAHECPEEEGGHRTDNPPQVSLSRTVRSSPPLSVYVRWQGGSAFERVLHYLYTGVLIPTEGSVLAVLKLARVLQIADLTSACLEYVEHTAHGHTALGYLQQSLSLELAPELVSVPAAQAVARQLGSYDPQALCELPPRVLLGVLEQVADSNHQAQAQAQHSQAQAARTPKNSESGGGAHEEAAAAAQHGVAGGRFAVSRVIGQYVRCNRPTLPAVGPHHRERSSRGSGGSSTEDVAVSRWRQVLSYLFGYHLIRDIRAMATEILD
jgi:hypothetical protein